MTKALTLHQPWASLIAEGAKFIETRSWSTKYRGPLIIHAGFKRPSYGRLGYVLCEPWWDADEVRHVDVDDCECSMDGVGPACGARSPSRMVLTGMKPDSEPTPLPLGAVVASCVLADVVPIVAHWPKRGEACLSAAPGPLYEWRADEMNGRARHDQEPFGDFTPGRFAWLLEDVKPTTERCPACWGAPNQSRVRIEGGSRACAHCNRVLSFNYMERHGDDCDCAAARAERCVVCQGAMVCDPIPAKGHQGLWEWTP